MHNYCPTSGCKVQESLRKLEYGSQDSTQASGCIELICAALSPIRLNTSTLFNSYSLFVSLISPLVLGQNYLNKIPFHTLIDSRFTHCFVDSNFVHIHTLKTCSVSPIKLYLFDDLSNTTISKIVALPIIFPSSKNITLDFYITLLDSSYFWFQNIISLPNIIY